MFIIRIQKKTGKNTKDYQIVLVKTKQNPTSSKIVEKLGFYTEKKFVAIKVKKLAFWISKGVKVSNKVIKVLTASSNFINPPYKKHIESIWSLKID